MSVENMKKIPEQIIKLISTGKVLDLGCGRGWATDYIHKDNYIGTTDIEFHKHYLQGFNIIIHRITSDNKLPFENNQFDNIIASHIIEHLDKQEVNNAMKEIKRVLKPKGTLILITPTGYSTGFNGNWTHWRPYNHGSLTGILRGYDYKNIKWGYPKIFNYPKFIQRYGRFLKIFNEFIFNEVIAYGENQK